MSRASLAAAAALVLVSFAVLCAQDAFDPAYLSRRSSEDEQASLGLVSIAKKLERKGLFDRARELAKVACDVGDESRKKDAQALLDRIEGKANDKRDDDTEKEIDEWAARHAKKYQEIAAYCAKKNLIPEQGDAQARIEWCVKISPRALPAKAPDAAGGAKGAPGDAAGVAAAGDPEHKILARVNEYRKNAGLSLVELDETLSVGCRAHCNYLVKNDGKPELEGLKAHEEVMTLPGATEEGAKAGPKSDIALGEGPVESVDAWVASLYHRVPILNPGLKKIGAGFMTGTHYGKVCVLDIQTDVEDAQGEVLYPADKLADVPGRFFDETPDPLGPGKHDAGFPVTLTGFGLPDFKDAQAKLERDGKEVACAFSSPEKPATQEFSQLNTICMIPREPLPSGATYKATFSYTKDDGSKVSRVVVFRVR
jgi:hypothetical protein